MNQRTVCVAYSIIPTTLYKMQLKHKNRAISINITYLILEKIVYESINYLTK